jgi:hypothetical protein
MAYDTSAYQQPEPVYQRPAYQEPEVRDFIPRGMQDEPVFDYTPPATTTPQGYDFIPPNEPIVYDNTPRDVVYDQLGQPGYYNDLPKISEERKRLSEQYGYTSPFSGLPIDALNIAPPTEVFDYTPPVYQPPTPFSDPRDMQDNPYQPSTPFNEPRELTPDANPYSPRIIEEETAVMAPPPQPKTPLGGYSPFGDTGRVDYRNAPPPPTQTQPQFFGQTPPTTFSEPEPRDYIPTPYLPRFPGEEPVRSEQREYMPAPYMPTYEPEPFANEDFMIDSNNPAYMAGGGSVQYAAAGKLLRGPGDGMSDDINANISGKQEARLADGEFVIPADVVSHLGNGSSEAGSRKLYKMMANIRKARTGKSKQAPAVKVDRYLPA